MTPAVCDFCSGRVNHAKLAATLRAERLARGLKVYWVAREIGINPAYLSQLESGRRPFTAKRYAAYRALLDGEKGGEAR